MCGAPTERARLVKARARPPRAGAPTVRTLSASYGRESGRSRGKKKKKKHGPVLAAEPSPGRRSPSIGRPSRRGRRAGAPATMSRVRPPARDATDARETALSLRESAICEAVRALSRALEEILDVGRSTRRGSVIPDGGSPHRPVAAHTRSSATPEAQPTPSSARHGRRERKSRAATPGRGLTIENWTGRTTLAVGNQTCSPPSHIFFGDITRAAGADPRAVRCSTMPDRSCRS